MKIPSYDSQSNSTRIVPSERPNIDLDKSISKKNSNPESQSAKISISPEAKILASFAAKGISTSLKSLSHSLQPGDRTHSTEAESYDNKGVITTKRFDKLLQQLGASQHEAKNLSTAFDIDKNSQITRNELLDRLGITNNEANSEVSQSVLRLMDMNGDNNKTVSAEEFANLQTKIIQVIESKDKI